MDDIGIVDHEHFSPMPIPVIGITLTVVRVLDHIKPWCLTHIDDDHSLF